MVLIFLALGGLVDEDEDEVGEEDEDDEEDEGFLSFDGFSSRS